MNKAQLIDDLIAEDRGAISRDCGLSVGGESIFTLIEKTVCTFHEMPYEVYKMEQYRQKVSNEKFYEKCSCIMCGKHFTVGIRTNNKGYSCSQKCMGELNTKRRLIKSLVILFALRYYDRKYIISRLGSKYNTTWKYIKLAYDYRGDNKYVWSLGDYINSKIKSSYALKQSTNKAA